LIVAGEGGLRGSWAITKEKLEQDFKIEKYICNWPT